MLILVDKLYSIAKYVACRVDHSDEGPIIVVGVDGPAQGAIEELHRGDSNSRILYSENVYHYMLVKETIDQT
jgi:hypothetical protein